MQWTRLGGPNHTWVSWKAGVCLSSDMQDEWVFWGDCVVSC